MTRAVHWRRDTERQRLGVLDCGVIRVGALSSRNKKRVTCKRCLKLIGAQQPSGAAGAAARVGSPSPSAATDSDRFKNQLSDVVQKFRAWLEGEETPFDTDNEALERWDELVSAVEAASGAIAAPSTARASAVKPVEHLATVAATDSHPKYPGFGDKYPGRCSTCGCSGTPDDEPDCNCNGYLSQRVEELKARVLELEERLRALKRGFGPHPAISPLAQEMLNERADHIRHLQDCCARLEALLREVVEADDALRAASSAYELDPGAIEIIDPNSAKRRAFTAIEAARGGIGEKNG